MQIADIQKKITPVLRSYGIRRARVFGSQARGSSRPDSDIDLLVQLGKPMGIVAYMRFVEQLEQALGRDVDVVTERSMRKHLADRVKADLTTVYESR